MPVHPTGLLFGLPRQRFFAGGSLSFARRAGFPLPACMTGVPIFSFGHFFHLPPFFRLLWPCQRTKQPRLSGALLTLVRFRRYAKDPAIRGFVVVAVVACKIAVVIINDKYIRRKNIVKMLILFGSVRGQRNIRSGCFTTHRLYFMINE